MKVAALLDRDLSLHRLAVVVVRHVHMCWLDLLNLAWPSCFCPVLQSLALILPCPALPCPALPCPAQDNLL